MFKNVLSNWSVILFSGKLSPSSLLFLSSVEWRPSFSPEFLSPICLFWPFSFMNRQFPDVWWFLMRCSPILRGGASLQIGGCLCGVRGLTVKHQVGTCWCHLLLRRSGLAAGGRALLSHCSLSRLLPNFPVFTISQTGLPLPPWCPKHSELLGAPPSFWNSVVNTLISSLLCGCYSLRLTSQHHLSICSSASKMLLTPSLYPFGPVPLVSLRFHFRGVSGLNLS